MCPCWSDLIYYWLSTTNCWAVLNLWIGWIISNNLRLHLADKHLFLLQLLSFLISCPGITNVKYINFILGLTLFKGSYLNGFFKWEICLDVVQKFQGVHIALKRYLLPKLKTGLNALLIYLIYFALIKWLVFWLFL